MKTVAQALKQREEYARRRYEAEKIELQILNELPPDLPCPTISNEAAQQPNQTMRVNAWASFSRQYGDTWHSADVLEAIERAGFTAVPATLARYGDWRRSVRPGLQEELPERSSNSELTDSEPIAPLWITPEQHVGPSAHAFYRSNTGLLLRVNVPAMPEVTISAKRLEFRGGWRYERGTAKLNFPERWHSVTDSAGTVVATVAAHSGAWVDTEQGVSGALYFTPYLEHAAFPLTPSQYLRRLEAQD